MPSSQTPNYNLNQWSKDDRVLMEDFNADNAKIDAALGALTETAATYVTITFPAGDILFLWSVLSACGSGRGRGQGQSCDRPVPQRLRHHIQRHRRGHHLGRKYRANPGPGWYT